MPGMEITIQQDRVLVFKDQLARPEAESIAWRNKSNAFGALNQVTSFISRPKDDDFELTSQDKTYLPFWHVVGTATYDYERQVHHRWPATGPEVTKLTLNGHDYSAKAGQIEVSVLEHCHQQQTTTVLIDGLTSQTQAQLEEYLSFAAKEVAQTELEQIAAQHAVVPPASRASAIIRDVSSKLIHRIEADRILEESLAIEKIDLYYRPVYSFTYTWVSKNKTGRVEVDGLTGKVSFNQKSFPELVSKIIDYDFLFDIGGDAAGTLIPGGSIAVKLAKKYIDSKKK
jgi:hypothetical protein